MRAASSGDTSSRFERGGEGNEQGRRHRGARRALGRRAAADHERGTPGQGAPERTSLGRRTRRPPGRAGATPGRTAARRGDRGTPAGVPAGPVGRCGGRSGTASGPGGRRAARCAPGGSVAHERRRLRAPLAGTPGVARKRARGANPPRRGEGIGGRSADRPPLARSGATRGRTVRPVGTRPVPGHQRGAEPGTPLRIVRGPGTTLGRGRGTRNARPGGRSVASHRAGAPVRSARRGGDRGRRGSLRGAPREVADRGGGRRRPRAPLGARAEPSARPRRARRAQAAGLRALAGSGTGP